MENLFYELSTIVMGVKALGEWERLISDLLVNISRTGSSAASGSVFNFFLFLSIIFSISLGDEPPMRV